MWLWIVAVAILVVGLVLLLIRKRLRSFGRVVQVEKARELFSLQRSRLEDLFLKSASASGKPRGLRWTGCTFEVDLALARERATGELLALVPVTIQFEAIEGGDMEGVEAVGNLRNASAVFFYQRGHWHTTGRAVFNLNPLEVIEHFKTRYEKVELTA